MKTFKMKSLSAAVVAGLGALGMSGAANAVHVNPDGLGQVLLFPYYTARAGQVTSIALVNTTSGTKAVKVRFLEGKNSREVLDFNLFLSPQDVWTGAVVATADGARLVSNDNSCVTPSDLFTEARSDPNGLALNAFKNYQYTGSNLDSANFPTLDRTREGYFEVLEMGVINPADAKIPGYIKHASTGVPANCPALDALDPGSGNATPLFPNVGGTYMLAPAGGLTGRASIINATTGANYTTDPTSLDAYSTAVNYSPAGNVLPSLAGGVSPLVSNVFTGTGVAQATWGVGRDAVSATIMRDTLMNEFILDAGTASLTDWIITFPTKREYVQAGSGVAPQPFTNNFPNSAVGSCDPYGVAVYNREEQTTTSGPVVILPSPRPTITTPPGAQLCWEANVLPFGTTSLLGSTNTNTNVLAAFVQGTGAQSTPGAATTPSLRGTNGPNGWALLSFNIVPSGTITTNQRTIAPTAGTLNGVAFTAVTGGVHIGLPVIGAALHNFNRSGVVSQYGGVIPHRYTRNITP